MFSLSTSEKEDVLSAFAILKRRCNGLFDKYADDIEEVKVDIFDFNGTCQYEYRCSEYGWKKQIWFMVELKDTVSKIPAEFRAQGHTLYYTLGKDGASGISSQKRQSQLVCGWQPMEDGSDLFLSTNDHNSINKIR